ncbi:LysM peptidoglycan-binding domain-containing protein [Actinophytocola oryzae]|uniref:LysM domain-containing protein n=1 Tax=Actinophytocola oryzae TaxID=502181 RepID=A0A4R7VB01_9PSEU|nr:LysM peptidoglycan-binding domain-containing protein [Actinophytocola oryzae]TDV46180.1 LysM domain-containing protein [Actinophytocola oryzae]
MTVAMVAGGANIAAGVAIGAAALAGARVPAMLRCTTLPNIGLVYFDFNPTEISVARTAVTSDKPSPARGGSRRTTPKVKPMTISVNNVIFEGLDTKLRCDTLLTWTNPSAGFLGQVLSAALGKNLKTEPPELTFQWGPPMIGFMYTVKLSNVKISYTRFTSAGIPIRAKLSITMNEQPSLLGTLPQNPTSGGLTGRRAHTVAHGESLQSIATANYGHPGAWRRIAEVNGIQDPNRVRPGATVYLPNPDELDQGRAR